MMERDIRAVLDGLGLLVQDSKDAGKLQAMRNYADAADNVELGHGDPAWQARLHHEAGRAASAACRDDAAAFHFRSAIALAKKSGQSSALSDKALDSLLAGKPCAVPR